MLTIVHPECRIFTFLKAKLKKNSDSENIMVFEFVTRRYWTLEALVGYLESLSAYFSCDIGTAKFGKSHF